MDIEIKGFIDVSLVDWDRKVSSVIFLPKCNLRCPFCHNVALVLHPETLPTMPFERIREKLEKNKGWIDGVVITGGEPTIHRELPKLCERIKDFGFLVKLDTNGTNPDVIRELIEKQLVDYIAMDVKAPLNKQKYSEVTGVNAEHVLGKVERSIEILLEGRVEYEFRTTVVPGLHKRKDIEKICERIKGCDKYALQNFRAGPKTMSKKFEKAKSFSMEELEAFKKIAEKFISNVVLRSH